MALSSEQIVSLTLGIMSCYPSYVFTRRYFTTKVLDFLLFAGVFICTIIASIANVFAMFSYGLFWIQLNVISINLTFLFLLIHSTRIHKSKTNVVRNIGMAWFSILFILILFWQSHIQEDTAKVLFFHLRDSPSNFHPHGAGLRIGDTIIYSSSHYLLGLLFWTFATLYLLYSYMKMKPAVPSLKTKKGKNLWVLTWSILLLWCLLLYPFVPKLQLINTLLLVVDVLIFTIILIMPETMLMSHVQLLRAMEFTNSVISNVKTSKNETIPDSLVDYLTSIPEDFYHKKE